MEKIDILAIALCIVIVIFAGYIAYLKAGIKFCIEMLACQHKAIENLAKVLENNNELLDKQNEWNSIQVGINQAQANFNNKIEKHITHNSPTGVAVAKRRHNNNNYDNNNISTDNHSNKSYIRNVFST